LPRKPQFLANGLSPVQCPEGETPATYCFIGRAALAVPQRSQEMATRKQALQSRVVSRTTRRVCSEGQPVMTFRPRASIRDGTRWWNSPSCFLPSITLLPSKSRLATAALINIFHMRLIFGLQPLSVFSLPPGNEPADRYPQPSARGSLALRSFSRSRTQCIVGGNSSRFRERARLSSTRMGSPGRSSGRKWSTVRFFRQASRVNPRACRAEQCPHIGGLLQQLDDGFHRNMAFDKVAIYHGCVAAPVARGLPVCRASGRRRP